MNKMVSMLNEGKYASKNIYTFISKAMDELEEDGVNVINKAKARANAEAVYEASRKAQAMAL